MKKELFEVTKTKLESLNNSESKDIEKIKLELQEINLILEQYEDRN